MRRRLLLSGPIGCGKSTLIKNALGPAAARAGGFVTVRVRDGSGALRGFELLPARSLASAAPAEGGAPFLTFGRDGPRRDDGAFLTQAAAMLSLAETAPFAVIDEFGGYELLLDGFTAALDRLLCLPVPLVGVLKAPPAAEELNRRMALGDRYLRAALSLRGRLEADPDTLLLETSGQYDAGAEAALGQWVREYVGSI